MQQLKMIRYNGALTERPLPEGFSFEFFNNTEEQIEDWLKICTNGLLPDTDRKWFENAIINHPDLVPDKDVFFVVNEKGERIATSASVKHKNGEGYVHMVASIPESRGKGIGHAMLCFGLSILLDRGCEQIVLTTDDFRLAAIKTYLDADFLPVIYHDDESDMRSRWDEVIKKLNYKEVKYLEES